MSRVITSSRMAFMLLRVTIVSAVVLSVAYSTTHAVGGPWTRKSGGHYLKVSIGSLSARQWYNWMGSPSPLFHDSLYLTDASFGATSFGFYGEYGFTDWLTGSLSTEYKVSVLNATNAITGLDTNVSSSGLADTWLSARIRLLPIGKTLAASASLAVKIPTGSPKQELPLGTGVFDYEASIALGSGFDVDSTFVGYAQASIGYRLRNKADNELAYLAELGVNIGSAFLVQGVLDGSLPVSGENLPPASHFPGSLYTRQSFSRITGSVIYTLENGMDVIASMSGYVAGTNWLSGYAIHIGFAWKK